MPKLLGVDDFRVEARAAHEATPGSKLGASPVYRVAVGNPKAAEDGSRRVRFVFSDGSIDRSGDTIAPAGWELGAFNENPVALWAHDASALPIGRATNVLVEGTRLMGDIEFCGVDEYPFADTVYRMVKGGYISAVSVGFMPIDYKWADDEDGRPWGIDFLQQELLEISVVPVPCNANALIEARAKGIDTRPLVKWAETILDGGGKLILPRTEVERLRKAAKEPPRGPSGQKAESEWLRGLAAELRALVRDPSGASETDPASGGALVPTCGREKDAECGLINPGECSVHKTQTDEEKRVAALVRAGVKAEVRRLIKAGKLRRRKSDDPEDDKPGEDEPDHAGEAREHMEAMGEALDKAEDLRNQADDLHAEAMDHHAEAMKCIKAMTGEDDPEDKSEDETTDKPDEDAEKAAAKRLKARLAAIRAEA